MFSDLISQTIKRSGTPAAPLGPRQKNPHGTAEAGAGSLTETARFAAYFTVNRIDRLLQLMSIFDLLHSRAGGVREVWQL
jgi:hypothetical protein